MEEEYIWTEELVIVNISSTEPNNPKLDATRTKPTRPTKALS